MSCIQLYSNSSMQGAGRHKEFPAIRLTHAKLRLSLSGWFCIRLPAKGLNNLAEVRIMLFATCLPLSDYGISVRPVKASTSTCSNTESDA